jgi:hypothetical protein
MRRSLIRRWALDAQIVHVCSPGWPSGSRSALMSGYCAVMLARGWRDRIRDCHMLARRQLWLRSLRGVHPSRAGCPSDVAAVESGMSRYLPTVPVVAGWGAFRLPGAVTWPRLTAGAAPPGITRSFPSASGSQIVLARRRAHVRGIAWVPLICRWYSHLRSVTMKVPLVVCSYPVPAVSTGCRRVH